MIGQSKFEPRTEDGWFRQKSPGENRPAQSCQAFAQQEYGQLALQPESGSLIVLFRNVSCLCDGLAAFNSIVNATEGAMADLCRQR